MDNRRKYNFEKMHDEAKRLAKKWLEQEYLNDDCFIEKRLYFYSFPQTWSNMSCGFGGIAGQAITTAQTNVFISTHANIAFVFVAGRFAYASKASAEFMKITSNHNLPGYCDEKDFEVLFTKDSIERVINDEKN